MLLLLVLAQVVLVTTSSGTAQKQGGMAESFSTGSENAEGRLSAVIGRRRFALGRGPEGWKPTPGGGLGWSDKLEERGPGPADYILAVAVSTLAVLLAVVDAARCPLI